MNTPWKVSVLGTGWIANRVHLPYLAARQEDQDDVETVALYDPHEERLIETATKFKVPACASLADFLSRDSDIVFVCTPSQTHADLAGAALRHGKHVLCEKPLALTALEARRLVELARLEQRTLFCCMTNRYREDVRSLKELVEEGTIGQPSYVRASWMRSRGIPARSGPLGDGVLWDLGSHLADLVLWVTGWRDLRAVWAGGSTNAGSTSEEIASWYDPEIDKRDLADVSPHLDTVGVGLQFEGNAWGNLEVSWCAHTPIDRTEILVLGTKGAIHLDSVFGWSPDRQKCSGPALRCTDSNSPGRWRVVLDEPSRNPSEFKFQLDQFFSSLAVSPGGELDCTMRSVEILERAQAQIDQWSPCEKESSSCQN